MLFRGIMTHLIQHTRKRKEKKKKKNGKKEHMPFNASITLGNLSSFQTWTEKIICEL